MPEMPHRNPTTKTLAELAQILDASLVGNGDIVVSQVVHPLAIQSEQDLVFAIEHRALFALQSAPAKAALVTEKMSVPAGLVEGYLVVERPRVALAALLSIFDKGVQVAPGIHPSAVVDETAIIDPSATIGAFSYVGPNAAIGANTMVMPHVTIGSEAKIGTNCLFHPGTRIGERVMIGNGVIIQHNASIGADGFSYVTPEMGSIESARQSGGKVEATNTEILRINSAGTVILEDNVEVGACSAIDRATLGATIIKKGTKIDNLVMIGHNNTVGENCLVVSQVGISGSCTIGDRVVLAGQAGIKDHTKIGNDSIVMAKAGVMNDLPEKSVVVGQPAEPQRDLFKKLAYMNRLQDMAQDIRELKRELKALKAEKSSLSEV